MDVSQTRPSSFLTNLFLFTTTPWSPRRGCDFTLHFSSFEPHTHIHTPIKSIIFKFFFKAKSILPWVHCHYHSPYHLPPRLLWSPTKTPPASSLLLPIIPHHFDRVIFLKSYTIMPQSSFNILMILKALRIKSKCLKTFYQAFPDQPLPPFLASSL